LAHALLNPKECSARRPVVSNASTGDRHRVTGVVTVLLVAAAAGCYTSPINRPPAITIIDPGTILRGTVARFQADVSDPDGDAVSVTWELADVEHCTPDTRPASPNYQPLPGLDQLDFGVADRMTLRPFCVWAFATDARGAVRAAYLLVNPQNQVPTVEIDVVQPTVALSYPLFTDFRLSPGNSIDPEDEPLDFSWSLQKPTGSIATLGPCADGLPREQCFTADVSGPYVVSLKVTDPEGAPNSKDLTLVVDKDRPPCLLDALPSLMSPTLIHGSNDPTDPSATPNIDGGVAPEFTILKVDDDGAPLPKNSHGSAQFRWSVAKNDEAFVPSANTSPSFKLTTPLLHIGDTARVRVDVLDGVNLLTGCDSDKCASSLACIQRFTWTITIQ
jgi:hypothetical protein